MSDILELIDNAIAGTTGPDAMSWSPKAPTVLAVPDPEQMRAVFAAAGARIAAMMEALRPAMEAWARQVSIALTQFAKVMPIIEQAQAARRVRVSRMHAAYGRRHR